MNELEKYNGILVDVGFFDVEKLGIFKAKSEIFEQAGGGGIREFGNFLADGVQVHRMTNDLVVLGIFARCGQAFENRSSGKSGFVLSGENDFQEVQRRGLKRQLICCWLT